MKKVLLASASGPFVERNATLLMNKGFQFFTASSGAEAFALHAEHGMDLFLCDLELEDMDGSRFCSEIRKEYDPQLVSVILICHNNVECIAKAKQSDASAILLRPINPTHLLITIGSFIDMQLARSRRVELCVPVSIRSRDIEFMCSSKDISITGILVEAEQQLATGTRLRCQFSLPDSSLIQQEGEIVRCFRSVNGQRQYGIKFSEMSASGRRAIERYVVSNNHLGVRQQPYSPLESDAGY